MTRKTLINLSKRGHALLRDRNYAEARQVFEEALLAAPDNLYLMTGLGETLRQQKDFANAAAYFSRLLEKSPENPFALRGLGDTMRGMKQYDRAIDFWKRYLELKGFKDVFVLTRIADCYKSLNRFEESETFYRRSLTLRANNRYALIGLADLLYRKGMDEQAIENYEKVLADGTPSINILTIVGNIHYRRRDFERARDCYQQALDQDPDNPYALYGMGNYYRWKNELLQAVAFWEKILENNTGTAHLLTRLGDAYRNLGRFEEAEQAYNRNLDKAFDLFSIIGMIKLRCLQSRMEEACDCYNELLLNEREDRKVFAVIGDMFIQRNEPDRALQFYRQVRQQQKEHPGIDEIIGERVRQLEEICSGQAAMEA